MHEMTVPAERRVHGGRGVVGGEIAVGFGRWLLQCHERARQRRQLAELEPRLCQDVGLTASAIVAEIDKPFWR